MKISIEIPRELPIKELDRFTDLTVYNIARMTLDMTNSKGHFPYLTGELQRSSMAYGVVGNNKTYELGATGVDYAPTVWDYPQSTNWTNPNTYAQWFMTEFKNDKEVIVSQAVTNALRSVK